MCFWTPVENPGTRRCVLGLRHRAGAAAWLSSAAYADDQARSRAAWPLPRVRGRRRCRPGSRRGARLQSSGSAAAERQRDEVAEFDELRLGEVLMQRPRVRRRPVGIPGDSHRPGERGAFAVIERSDFSKLRMSSTCSSVAPVPGEYRTLAAAVLAFDRLGDVEAAEFFDRVSVTPWRKKASQAMLNAFMTGGLCSRMAWLSVAACRAGARAP